MSASHIGNCRGRGLRPISFDLSTAPGAAVSLLIDGFLSNALQSETDERRITTETADGMGYAVNDLAGKITEISTSYANALGFRRDELIGRNFGEVVAPERCEEAEQCFARALESGAGYLRAVYALPDGGRIAVNVSLMPVRNDNGRVVSMLIVPQAGSLTPQRIQPYRA